MSGPRRKVSWVCVGLKVPGTARCLPSCFLFFKIKIQVLGVAFCVSTFRVWHQSPSYWVIHYLQGLLPIVREAGRLRSVCQQNWCLDRSRSSHCGTTIGQDIWGNFNKQFKTLSAMSGTKMFDILLLYLSCFSSSPSPPHLLPPSPFASFSTSAFPLFSSPFPLDFEISSYKSTIPMPGIRSRILGSEPKFQASEHFFLLYF